VHVFHFNSCHGHITDVADNVSVGDGLAEQHGASRGCGFDNREIGRGGAIVGEDATDDVTCLCGESDWHSGKGRNIGSGAIGIAASNRFGIGGDQ